MTPLHFAGERLALDPMGALLWPAQRLMAVADLHLEKGSAAARQGQLIPPWDSAQTLDRLSALLRRHAPRTVVLLGDTFHDDHGPSRLAASDAARLTRLTEAADLIWVRGNHDPGHAPFPTGVRGTPVPAYRAGPLTFRHQAEAGAAAEISGHFHPKARVPTRAGEVCRPCFVADGRKLILPALGAYTGGLDVRAPVIAAHFPRGGRVFLLGRDRVFSFALPPSRPAGLPARAAPPHPRA